VGKNDSLEARVLSRDSSHLSDVMVGSLVSDDAKSERKVVMVSLE